MKEERIGPYLIEKRLGQGGMAEVFLARKPVGPKSFKQVVVKRIRKDLVEDDRFVEMFLREAGILSQLNHPNVVQIFDLGQDDDGFYIALEYLDGMSVRQLAVRSWRAHEPVPLELTLRVVAETARGLEYVHRQRLVHRDIAPDNIFLCRDGTVKVLDFGVARGAEMKALTEKGELKGKIPYMAPEQLDSSELDGRADLFSLGVTAYWLLTGRRPFRGVTELEIMRAVLNNQPDPPASLNPEIEPWLNDLVMGLLEKNREHRVQSGTEVDATILQHCKRLDRTADVVFITAVLARAESDLEDVSQPVPAAPRNAPFVAKSTVRIEPRPITLGPTAHEAEPRTAVTAATAAPATVDEADVIEALLDGPTARNITLPETATIPKRPPAPRALAVDMPVAEEGGDTIRLPLDPEEES